MWPQGRNIISFLLSRHTTQQSSFSTEPSTAALLTACFCSRHVHTVECLSEGCVFQMQRAHHTCKSTKKSCSLLM